MSNENMTTADLRTKLLDALDAVRAGELSANDAKAIATLAETAIATAELELRYSETLSRLDKDNQGISSGPLMLTGARKSERAA